MEDIHIFTTENRPQGMNIPDLQSARPDTKHGHSRGAKSIRKLSVIPVNEDTIKGMDIPPAESIQEERFRPSAIQTAYEECHFHFLQEQSRQKRRGDRFAKRIFLMADRVE